MQPSVFQLSTCWHKETQDQQVLPCSPNSRSSARRKQTKRALPGL